MSNLAEILDKLAVRETIEDYLHFLDAGHWGGVAGCFSVDAVSYYNFEPAPLIGGDGVVAWLRSRLAPYLGTDHALSHLHIELDGDVAACESRVTASLLYQQNGERRIAVRAIRYQDKLCRDGNGWLICQRRHEPQWQYEATAQALRV